MADEKIRVHNKGKRSIDYLPEKGRKPKYIMPGRAVTMEKKMAEKYLVAYPKDLIEFDSLVSGEKKNLSKENARLESVVSGLEKSALTLAEEIETLKNKNAALEDAAILSLEEIETLESKVSDLEKPATKVAKETKSKKG